MEPLFEERSFVVASPFWASGDLNLIVRMPNSVAAMDTELKRAHTRLSNQRQASDSPFGSSCVFISF
jgi:hypothetical protein